GASVLRHAPSRSRDRRRRHRLVAAGHAGGGARDARGTSRVARRRWKAALLGRAEAGGLSHGREAGVRSAADGLPRGGQRTADLALLLLLRRTEPARRELATQPGVLLRRAHAGGRALLRLHGRSARDRARPARAR